MMISGLFAVIVVSIDWHVPHDSDFAVFVVRHRLWFVLVPLVLMMISGLFAVIVLSVLTGMSHMIVILLSLLCVTDSGLCSYHLSITSIS